MVTIQRVTLKSPTQQVTLYALIDEAISKQNILPTTDVEGGFAISQHSRPAPRSGTLNIILVDPMRLSADLPGVNIPSDLSKEAQKNALDDLFDLRKSQGNISLISDLETVTRIAIEDIEYTRTKYTNQFVAAVRWKEIRTAQTAVVTIERTGKIDPATNTFIDAPPLDQGFIITPTREDDSTEAADAHADAKAAVLLADIGKAGHKIIEDVGKFIKGLF